MPASDIMSIFVRGIREELKTWKATELANFAFKDHWVQLGMIGVNSVANHFKVEEQLVEAPEVVFEADQSISTAGSSSLCTFWVQNHNVFVSLEMKVDEEVKKFSTEKKFSDIEEEVKTFAELQGEPPMHPLDRMKEQLKILKAKKPKTPEIWREIANLERAIKKWKRDNEERSRAMVELLLNPKD